jgi:hypothetical protein
MSVIVLAEVNKKCNFVMTNDDDDLSLCSRLLLVLSSLLPLVSVVVMSDSSKMLLIQLQHIY